MKTLDVKNNLGIVEPKSLSFIKDQLPDADAAYQRLSITRKALKMYQRDINDTNTSDVTGELASLYEQLEQVMQLIILAEQQLIFDGE